MWTDLIVEELHSLREAHAKQFGYDIKAMAEDIREQEQQSGKNYVSLPIQRQQSQAKSAVENDRKEY